MILEVAGAFVSESPGHKSAALKALSEELIP